MVQVKLSDYLGAAHFNGAALERSGAPPDPSMAHVRQALTEYAVLPLGSATVHERLEPHVKAVLLYGQHDTGKKLLAHAVANTTGAPELPALPCVALLSCCQRSDLVWPVCSNRT